jgi:LysR family nitrogen assimilation transcriptional regulator
MDLRQLRYFVTVAKSGSFTAASHVLHISQPALGLQVKQLEEQLGTRLLARHSRGVTLTKAGSVFLNHASTILSNVEQAEASLLPFKANRRTDILFGVTPSTGRTIIPELIEDCARSKSPSVRIVVQQGHSAELLEQTEAGSLDMVFCYDRPKSKRLGAMPLYGEDLVIVGPPDLLGPEKGDVAFADLPNFPLIMSGTQRGARAFVEQTAAEQEVDLSIRYEVEALGLKRELLLRNRCCTIVSYGLFLDDIQSGVFGARRIVAPTLSRDFLLVFRRDLPGAALDLVRSSVRAIVERRLGDRDLGWRRLGGGVDRERPAKAAAAEKATRRPHAALRPASP